MGKNKSTIFINAVDKASKTFKSIGSKLGRLAKSALSSKFAIAGLSAAVGLAVRDFAIFQEKVANVVNLFDGGKKDIDEFSSALIDMSTRVPKSTDDLADSLFDVISAGVEVGESLKFLESASKLAVAGVTDTKVAVDGLTSVMNAYGIEASRVDEISDKFFAAQVEGKTTIEELSSSIGKVAPLAKSAGVGMDELFGSISSLTKQGVRTAEAVTQVRGTIASLIKPTKEARDEADRLGIDFGATAVKSKGLSQVLMDVIDATGGNTDEIAKLFPRVEALNGVLALSVNEFKDLRDIQKKVENSSGATEKAFNTQAESMSTNIKLLGNEIKAFSKEAVAQFEPVINSVLKMSKSFFSGLRGVMNMTQNFENLLYVTGLTSDEFLRLHVNLRNSLREFVNGSDSMEQAKKNLDDILNVTGMTVIEFSKLAESQQKALVEMVEKTRRANQKQEQEQERHNKEKTEKQKEHNEDIEQAQDEHSKRISEIQDELTQNQVKNLKNLRDEIIRELAIRRAIHQDDRDERTEKEIAGLEVMLSETQRVLRDRTGIYSAENKEIIDDYQETLDEMGKRTSRVSVDMSRQIATLGEQMVTDFQGFTKSLIERTVSGQGGLTDQLFTSMSDTIGTTAASFTSGAVGGVVAQGVSSIVSGIFGKSGKSVHDFAQDAFDEMVDRTNEKLLQLGRERTTQEKQVDLLEELKDSLGGSAILPERFLDAIEVEKGTTIDQALTEVFGRSIRGNVKEREILEEELRGAKKAQGIIEEFLEIINTQGAGFKNRKEAYNRAIELAFTRFTKGGEERSLLGGPGVGVTTIDRGDIEEVLEGKQRPKARLLSEGALRGTQARIEDIQAELEKSSLESLEEAIDNVRLKNKIADITGQTPDFDSNDVNSATLQNSIEKITGQVPGFASGGIIPGNQFNGDRVFMRANSGERVMTRETDDQLHRMISMLNQKLESKSGGNIVVKLMLDKKELSKTIIDLEKQREAGIV